MKSFAQVLQAEVQESNLGIIEVLFLEAFSMIYRHMVQRRSELLKLSAFHGDFL